MSKKIWVSFTEEFWQGQIENTWVGRLEYEIVGEEKQYPEEIGFSCRDSAEVEKLRDKYDWQELSESEFEELKKEIGRVIAINKPKVTD